MTTEKTKKWSDGAVATLLDTVGTATPVSAELVHEVAEKLGVSVRSVAAKLRQLDREVASLAKERVATFTAEEGESLAAFVQANEGTKTYADIAAEFAGGKFSPKQIQGKLLALDLTSKVKPAEKIEVARTYTPDEEATFISLANAGKFIEEIASALNRPIASVRGKALSLTRSGHIAKIPAQKESHSTKGADPVDALGDLSKLTVAEIAAKTDKTERGIKTLLTRRGVACADYDGAAKQAKAAGKRAQAAA